MNKDAFILWQQNEVTQMFMREMRDGLIAHIEYEVWGKTAEEIGVNAIIRKAKIEEIVKVLKWKPEGVGEEIDVRGLLALLKF